MKNINSGNFDVTFTIVIPTLNRCGPLQGAIKSALASDYHNLIVLVSNNSSEDETDQFCHTITDSRFRYIKTDHRMGMSKHWDFALKHVQDGYVMFLGDDDAILPNSASYLVSMLELHGLDCASCQGYVRFLWPDDSMQSNGTLYLPICGGSQIVSTDHALKNLMLGKNSDFHYLPNLYHGAASVRLLNSLKDVSGEFFLGIAPDLYAAITLASGTENFLSVDIPLTIGGLSPTSNGKQCQGNSKEADEILEEFVKLSDIPCHVELEKYTNNLQITCYEHYLKMPIHIPRKLETNLATQLNIAFNQVNKNNIVELDKLRQMAVDKSIDLFKKKQSVVVLMSKIFIRLRGLLCGIYLSNTAKIQISDSYEAVIYCIKFSQRNLLSKTVFVMKNYFYRLLSKLLN